MAQIERATGYIEVEPGVEIYYESRGSGRPLVFVPGWTFTKEVFAHQLEHFARSHRVVAIDPRSHGRSTLTLTGNDYATHGADLAKVMAALNLQNAVLVGWSFGCLTAWSYIRQQGLGSLKGLVTIDLSPKPLSVDPADWVEGPLDDLAAAYQAFLKSPAGQREFVTMYARDVMVQRELSAEEMDWIVAQSLQTPTFAAAALFADGLFCNHLPEAELAAQSLPTLCVVAEHWADTATAFMQKHCPATKTAVLGGHMMFWEHPKRFNQLLDEFLQNL